MERLKKIIVDRQMSIKQAMKRMDESGVKLLLVSNSDGQLLGVLSDGDIRRWMLKGKSLEENISRAMNKNPIYLAEGFSTEEAKDLMVSRKIDCIPVVDLKKRIVSAIWWVDLFEEKLKKHEKITADVAIMAGGEGSRLAPLTRVIPKPLIPIGDKPIIEVIMDRFMEFGCRKFYLSINYKSNLIKAYFSDSKLSYDIEYIEEEKPLGTAGSLHLLLGKVNKTFFVNNCDILIEADYAAILKFHKEKKNKITLVASMKHYTIPYGVCELSEGGKLGLIREKPEYDFLVNTGMYVLEPEVIGAIPTDRCYHITDLLNDYMARGEKIGVFPISEKSWLDMGQWEEYKILLDKFGIQKNE